MKALQAEGRQTRKTQLDQDRINFVLQRSAVPIVSLQKSDLRATFARLHLLECGILPQRCLCR